MGIFKGEKEVVADSHNTSLAALKCPDRFYFNLSDSTFCVYPVLIK